MGHPHPGFLHVCSRGGCAPHLFVAAMICNHKLYHALSVVCASGSPCTVPCSELEPALQSLVWRQVRPALPQAWSAAIGS